MPPGMHSKYGPSKSHTWINCPASIMMAEGLQDTTNPASEFGTQTHELGEHLIKERLGIVEFDDSSKITIEDLTKSLSMFDSEMMEMASGYADFVIGIVEAERKRTGFTPVVLVEQNLSLETCPDIFGTLDLAIISSDGTLTIVDLKTGRVKVEIEDWMGYPNPQLGIYALMAYRTFSKVYNIKKIVLRVYQPRLQHCPELEMSSEVLLNWEKCILLPAVKETKVEMPRPVTGDHCKYCTGRFRCSKRYDDQISVYEKRPINKDKMTDEEVEAILPKLDEMSDFIEDVKEYALNRMLSGVKFKGFKLVESQTRRKIDPTKEKEVAEIIRQKGLNPYSPPKLLSISELEKLLKKKLFNELLGDYVIKPKGSPVMAPESDDREEILINKGEQDNA